MSTTNPPAPGFAGRVAIIHYHLRTGGVTRVIQHAVEALRNQGCKVVVFSGEPPDAEFAGEVRILPELAYSDTAPAAAAAQLRRALRQQASASLGGAPDLWHIHNHCLGKNLTLPALVHDLATAGEHLVLQIHDFAEDGRPDRYRLLASAFGPGNVDRLAAKLYPAAEHIHYALLNSRDYTFLRQAGVPLGNLHLLPNAVWLQHQPLVEREPDPQHRLFIYPTRAIRRKNIGEFLLWSMLGDANDRFAVTRAPQNPSAKPVYESWLRLSTELQLPVEFEFGANSNLPFAQTMQLGNALLTTSVGEGFGLAFLEPWLLGRPLLGRNLPEVTTEFSEAGVDLSSLYERLDVPLELVDRKLLRQSLHQRLQQVYQSYGCTFAADIVERAFIAAAPHEHVDFGRLDEAAQQKVLRLLHGNRSLRRQIMPATLTSSKQQRADVVARNCAAVRQGFSLEQYGQRLSALYQQAAAATPAPVQTIDGARLLQQFMAPERFCLLRS